MRNMMQQISGALDRPDLKARAILRWAMAIVIVASVVTGRGLSDASSADPEIMARVNGEAITRAEWQRMLTDSRARLTYQQEHGGQEPKGDELQRWALRMLINKRLALQEATRLNITVAEGDVDRAVARWKARMKSVKKVQRYLKSRGLDESSLRDIIRTDMLMTRATAAVIQGARVSDEQVQKYYEAHKAELTVPEEVRLKEGRPARTKTLEEARPEIEKRLLSVKQREVLQAWLTEQEKMSKIEIFLQPTGSGSAISSQLSALETEESVGEE
jgi:hypothetical protein